MRPYFKNSSEIASSSAVEAEFCDLKHRGFKSQLPIKVDKFIVQHLDFLDAKITLASNENDVAKNTSLQSNKKDTTCDSMEVDDYSMEIGTNNHELSITDIDIESDNDKNNFKQSFEDNITDTLSDISVKSIVCALDTDLDNKNENNWNIRENWHGLANSSNITDSVQELPETSTLKKRSKPSYLDKCPEWDFLKNTKSFNLPVLINGSKCRPIKQGKSLMTVQQTCAFDSILQLVTNGLAAHATYRNAIQSSKGIFQLARSILENGKILLKHYHERASILQDLSIFSDAIKSYTRDIKRLNANCNTAHLTEYLFKDEPSCIFTKSCSCSELHSRQTITHNINVDILLNEGLAHMERAIDDIKNIQSKCRTCGALAETTVTYGKHIIIDTSIFTDNRYKRTDLKHNLNSIAKTILLNNTNYILTGVVHYIPHKNHYIALAYTGKQWYEYNDLKKKRITINPNRDVTPHVIMYVICE